MVSAWVRPDVDCYGRSSAPGRHPPLRDPQWSGVYGGDFARDDRFEALGGGRRRQRPTVPASSLAPRHRRTARQVSAPGSGSGRARWTARGAATMQPPISLATAGETCT